MRAIKVYYMSARRREGFSSATVVIRPATFPPSCATRGENGFRVGPKSRPRLLIYQLRLLLCIYIYLYISIWGSVLLAIGCDERAHMYKKGA